MKPLLSRRALLRGLGGTALALPFLDCMSTARSAQSEGRLVVVFGGFSSSVDGHQGANLVVPATMDYAFTDALAPLTAVREHLTMVTGLSIPVGDSGGHVPPGGRFGGIDSFHHHVAPLLTGAAQVGDGISTTVTSPSVDQLAVPELGVGSRFGSLTLRGQAAPYAHATTEMLTPSFRATADGILPVQPTTDPRALFRALTSSLRPDDAAGAAEREAALGRRRSVLDLVDRRMEGLLDRMGRSDKDRVEQHFAHIRELELRLETPMVAEGGVCRSPAQPPAFPVDNDLRWSHETERVAHLVELTRLALSCDLTRVVALMLTPFASDFNLQPAFGREQTFHIAHHTGTNDDTRDAITWHMQAFADLVSGLQEAPAADGTLLDHTAAAFVMEGGFSMDPTTTGDIETNAHSTEHMAILLAGRAGGLRPGRRVHVPGAHPAQVLLTAGQAAGMTTTALGDITEDLGELY